MNFKFMFLFLIFMPLSAVGGVIEVTIHVDDAYKPFSFSDKGTAKGMYIDVLRVAFSKMKGFKVTMEPIPWKRGKVMMAQGEGFGLTPSYFHGHDWPYLYPYSLPFYTETVIAVCTEEVLKQPRPHWPEDYKGLAIGNVAGFDGWGGDKFRDLVEKGKIDYYEVHSSESLIKMIIQGRHDCIMMEARAFDFELKRLNQAGVYNGNINTKLIKGAIVGADSVSIGYSEPSAKSKKYPYAYEFQKAFDVVIYQMNKSGEIEKIMSAYQD